MQDDPVALIDEAIDHLMQAAELVGRTHESYLDDQALGPIATAASVLRSRSYTLKSKRGGQRWPPEPETSG